MNEKPTQRLMSSGAESAPQNLLGPAAQKSLEWNLIAAEAYVRLRPVRETDETSSPN